MLMTKERQIALLYKLIEKHYGYGVLMQFVDITHNNNIGTKRR